jgi:hypothetical protein
MDRIAALLGGGPLPARPSTPTKPAETTSPGAAERRALATKSGLSAESHAVSGVPKRPPPMSPAVGVRGAPSGGLSAELEAKIASISRQLEDF